MSSAAASEARQTCGEEERKVVEVRDRKTKNSAKEGKQGAELYSERLFQSTNNKDEKYLIFSKPSCASFLHKMRDTLK